MNVHCSIKKRKDTDLVLVDFCFFQLRFSLCLECDDNQSHENVDEKEGEDNEEDNVENGHFDSKQRDGSFVFVSGRHGVLQYTVGKLERKDRYNKMSAQLHITKEAYRSLEILQSRKCAMLKLQLSKRHHQ